MSFFSRFYDFEKFPGIPREKFPNSQFFPFPWEKNLGGKTETLHSIIPCTVPETVLKTDVTVDAVINVFRRHDLTGTKRVKEPFRVLCITTLQKIKDHQGFIFIFFVVVVRFFILDGYFSGKQVEQNLTSLAPKVEVV